MAAGETPAPRFALLLHGYGEGGLGRYGGTFAHPDIAFEFGMRISPEFKIDLVKEFRR